ncbi:MAG TPA: hypothetical protein VNA14_04155 [Mycobacteriales bacterium]|nr:hypothetical protein [Mycobacteriales bacterium]
MLFLLPIPISLVLALVWAAWTTRPRRPAEAVVTVQEYQRALAVLAKPLPQRARPRPARELVASQHT